MNPRNPISRRFPRIVTLPKGYIIITKAGIKFVRERYSCSVALDKGEIKLYEFLLRILSSDGTLPLTLIRRWQENEILKKALEKHYVTVTTVKRELPKNEFQELANEIWGKIPKGIYI